MHSLLSFPSSLQISDSGESLSLSNVNLLLGVFWTSSVNYLSENKSKYQRTPTKVLSCCSGDVFAISCRGVWMFVDDLGEEQWHDVMGVSDRVFTNSGRRAEVPMIFCTVGYLHTVSILISTLGHTATLKVLVAVQRSTGE
jgi:hypothetical protein